MTWWTWLAAASGLLLVVLAGTTSPRPVTQSFATTRSVGHFRYMLEAIGPELRQYLITDNDEERPFSRDQRRWVYASAKAENAYFGFGTDSNLDATGYPVFRHAAFPVAGSTPMPLSRAPRRSASAPGGPGPFSPLR